MRKPRGHVFNKDGYFHIESLLNPGLMPWTPGEARDYAELLKNLVVLSDVELVFWIIHPRGFGLILRKTPDIAYSREAKMEALERIGEGKFAQRWKAQSCEGAKPLARGHQARRDYFSDLSHNLSVLIKTFKQRVSVAYNKEKNFGGVIWRERAKVFHLPNEASALSDVAAFILAQAEMLSGEDCLNWPGTVAEARAGASEASQCLQQILQTEAPASEQLNQLLQHREDILEKAGTRIRLAKQGPPSLWRPTCERL